MPSFARRPLGSLLVEAGLITKKDLADALTHQKAKGGPLGKVLIELGIISAEDLQFALAAQAGMEIVDLNSMEIPKEVVELVDVQIAETFRVVPVAIDPDKKCITLALADPMNITIQDELRFMLNLDIKCAASNPADVEKALSKYYGDKRVETIQDIIEDVGEAEVIEEGDRFDITKLEKDISSKPVVKLVNHVLLQAIKDRASDIHLEPFENEFRIRYRVDGVLYEMMPPPAHLGMAITSRVKVMAKLDIAETRLPQDGRIELNMQDRSVDLRISTLPTMFGESVVMRVLDRSNVNLDLEVLGFSQQDLVMVRKLLSLPHGIILVTGPTGSGKTTTLYSCLNELNDIENKIITAENPVEYDLPGIMQVAINEEISVTYAAILRSMLRQDPDIILVGEVRDIETAQIAIQASLTGHLVFSTLHTNDAPSTVIRLIDLGVEDFLISATLEAVIAQRLVRKICDSCRTEYKPTNEEIFELGLMPADVGDKIFYYGPGCQDCNGTGYKGRLGLFEIMILNERLRQMIMKEVSTQKLQEVARESGMRTLRDAGLDAIFNGLTTIEEVVKETILTQ
jgi:type IV pilus assembly protein PilB